MHGTGYHWFTKQHSISSETAESLVSKSCCTSKTPMEYSNLGNRREIKILVLQSWDNYPPEYTSKVFQLNSRLQALYRTMPADLDDEGLKKANSERTQQNSFFVHSVYYLCLIYLHASTIPRFAGSKESLKISQDFADYSIKKVTLNAQRFAEVAKRYLATTPDFSRLPPFAGYCAYIAGSVHRIIVAIDKDIQRLSQINYVVCLAIIEELKLYYPTLDSLV